MSAVTHYWLLFPLDNDKIIRAIIRQWFPIITIESSNFLFIDFYRRMILY